MGVTKVQRANANYWIEAVAEGGEDYYTKPGEVPGEWQGELAAELGLDGQIDRAAYALILGGREPQSGEELVHRPPTRTFTDSAGRERKKEPVLAYDVRFAAPKSVSLLYALGDEGLREQVLGAYDRAVAAGVRYLEQEACFVQRGRGGKVIESGEGFCAMAFRHRMSRAGDPALHTHVLVPNMTRAERDGRWLSLAAPKGRSALYQHAKAAGYVFQAQLRAELTRELGVQWTPTRNGYADVKGIPRDVIDHFSQRRAEITAALAQLGVSSAKAAEVAAYRTRDAKDYGVDPDQRRTEWAARAQEFGLSPERIGELAAEHSPRPARGIRDADLAAAIADLERTRSHFDRRELICALANRLPEGAELSALSWAADHVLAGERVICIARADNPSVPAYYTTPRIWTAEQRFCEIASEGQNAGAATVSSKTVTEVLSRHSYLGADQAEMVRRLTEGGERVVPVAARPGAGKTTALAAARDAWEVESHPVIGVASARTASGELSDIGVRSTSIAALLDRAEDWRSRGIEPLLRGTVIVMDEASTASTLDAVALAELVAGCDGKLVAIGDPRQIGAVGPGGLFGHLTHTIEPSMLTEIRRQQRLVDRRIVELAHEGRGSDALDLLKGEGRLQVADTIDEARCAVVLDWYAGQTAGADSVMIARRNRDVADLNADARELLVGDGTVGQEAIRIAERDFATGDQVLTRVNTAEVSNRERWQITAVDQERGEIELARIGGHGRSVTLGPDYLDRYTDGGEAALQHAYAMTIYGTQSKTFDRAYALLDGGASSEEFVVAVSRAREETIAYGVASIDLTDPELGPGRRMIEDELHEIRAAAERPAADFAALEVSLRDQIAQAEAPELPRRQAELLARQRDAEREPPGREPLADLKQRIELAEYAHRSASTTWEDLGSSWRPDKLEQVRAQEAEARSSENLRRMYSERDGLVAAIVDYEPPSFDASKRLELSLITERLDQLRRREIGAERLHPSSFVHETLGDRPSEPRKLAAWNDGVHEIYSYRQRHGVSDPERPLGAKPSDPRERAHFARAELAIRHVQRQLQLGRELGMERSLGLERGISIGL
ncbi:MAG: MobF family relaxase [Actinomycetota bacterium]